MNHFKPKRGVLHAEAVPLPALARAWGTPTYVYSSATLTRHWRVLHRSFAGIDHTVCYSVKANSNLSVLSLFARLGSGFDIVSAGELYRVMKAGGEARRVVYSGVGKRDDEIAFALDAGVGTINVESAAELGRVSAVARRLSMRAPIAFRVNPDVDPKTHPYIATGLRESKFGVPVEGGPRPLPARRAGPPPRRPGHRLPHRLADHQPAPLRRRGGPRPRPRRGARAGRHPAAPPRRRRRARRRATGTRPRPPRRPTPPRCGRGWAAGRGRSTSSRGGSWWPTPACSSPASSTVKKNGRKTFVVVDAAMNDLMRPALYDAWHEVEPVVAPPRGRAGGDLRRRRAGLRVLRLPGPGAPARPAGRGGPPLPPHGAGPTASPCPPTTTPGRGPPRCWWTATRPGWRGPARRYPDLVRGETLRGKPRRFPATRG